MTAWCAACGKPRGPGELLRVIPAAGEPFAVCRPHVASFCLALAGTRDVSTIALYDAAAAASFDRATGGQPVKTALDYALASSPKERPWT